MEKFYKELGWLDIDQAADCFSRLTGESMTPQNLMVLCSKKRCDAYLTRLVNGESFLEETGEACLTASSGTYHLINFPHPHTWASGEPWKFCVIGTVTQYDSSPSGGPLRSGRMRFESRVVENCTWFVSLSADEYAPTFKEADIQSLADSMNGKSTKASELEQTANKELQLASSESTQRQHSNPEFRPDYSNEHVARSIRTGGIGKERLIADEVYRQLDWLTLEQALDWMEIISNQKIEPTTLYVMADTELCSMYADCRGVRGVASGDKSRLQGKTVFGMSYCQINNPLRPEGRDVSLTGPVMFFDDCGNAETHLNYSWYIDPEYEGDPLFQPSEIEVIGGMITEGGGWSNPQSVPEKFDISINLVNLLSSLKFKTHTKTDGSREYSVMFNNGKFIAKLDENFELEVGAENTVSKAHFECERAARIEAEERARNAESEAAALRRAIAKQSAPKQPEVVDAKNPPPGTELVFPYSTKELEAMRRVALEHWAAHTPDKRQPKQDAIQRAICEELGLNAPTNKTPPNKAIYLATAIKPDDLPKA
ncbi:hypothetical protein PS914_05342 [Pseudomonas fluorescens]|uniref:hypothetical protein n=1 Tax=Pseudomonas fluorescens TaxID=294 RepID=UPI00124249D4|nr:hypothetical protein [Pseudomonas fluorescens]VVQ12315.1 hypothetical protein PS914_05342 [Pseudomonas fluorescens]